MTHAGPTKMCRVTSDLWSPSQVLEENSGKYTMEMSKLEINDLINSFRESARNVIESGFDGIEIKVAHDGLLRAFISPVFNKRSDAGERLLDIAQNTSVRVHQKQDKSYWRKKKEYSIETSQMFYQDALKNKLEI